MRYTTEEYNRMESEVAELIAHGEDVASAIAAGIDNARARQLEYLRNLNASKVIAEFDRKIDSETCGLDRDIAIQEGMAREILELRKTIYRLEV